MENIKNACEWMKNIDDSKKINEFNIAGTHDSAAVRSSFVFFTNCQHLDIKDQLNIGVRFLDIRLQYDSDGNFHAVHAKADCYSRALKKITFKDILSDCYGFLEEHPSETILMLIKEDDGNAGKEFYRSIFETQISKNKTRWFLENRIPSLSEVRGKIVLLSRLDIDFERFDDSNSGLNLSAWSDQGCRTNTEFLTFQIERADKKVSLKAAVQDRYGLKSEQKYDIAYKKLCTAEADKNTIVINYLSTAGELIPKKAARKINRKFCADEFKPRCPQIVLFDFVTYESAQKVFGKNQKVSPL